MTAQGKTIAQNTSFLTVAYIAQKIIAFIYFTIVARWIGATDVGQYSFAVSFALIFSVIMDFGLSNVLIRESSKYPERANVLLNTIITAKLGLSILGFALVAFILQFLEKSGLVELMVYIAALAQILDSFTLSFWGIFRAHQDLKYESLAITINQIVVLGVGLGGLALGMPIYILVIALLAGALFSFLYSLTLLFIKMRYRLAWAWDTVVVKPLVTMAIPFGLAAIFTKIYSHIDQIFLSTMLGDTELGWYSIAYKLTFAFMFIPGAFAGAIYPAMSALYHQKSEQLQVVYEKSVNMLLMIAVPISIGIAVIAKDIILLVYTSEFAESIPVLQVWIAALVFVFLSYPAGALLNASDRQAINTRNMGITMVVNVVLNLILIPLLGVIGSAVAGLLAWATLVLLNMIYARVIVSYSLRHILLKALQALVAGAVMGAAVWYTKSFSLLFGIGVGAVVYPIVLYVVRGVTKEDMVFIKNALTPGS